MGFVRIHQRFNHIRSSRLLSHRVVKAAVLAALVTVCGTDMLQDAVANGDTRTLTLHHVHSGESATVTFKRNGRYDPAALKQLNVLLQDWRRKQPTNMDPQLFDIVWEVYRETGATQPIEVIGGFRSPETNAMLRARSRGVAQTSLHMQGKAMDFYIPGVPLSKIREAGLRLQRGGVGFYPTSGSPFVHLDTGGVRHWPRMSRPELARVFPNGKTVHVPTDGKPMSGYALALAEVESRGKEPGGAGGAFAGLGSGNNPKPKNLFASLFGKGDSEDDEDSAAPAKVAAAPARPAPAAAPEAPAPAAAAPVAVAAAAPAAVPLPQPAPQARNAPLVPAEAPANIPFAVASAAPAQAAAAALVPLPTARPGDAPKAGAVVAALAPVAVPMPTARPSEAGRLPELFVANGANGQGPVLAYASATAGVFPSNRLQPGRAAQPAQVPGVNAPLAAGPAPHAPARTHAAASPKATGPYTSEMQAEIRGLFLSPTVATHVVMRTPELRRFAAFVAPPRQVVAAGFGKDGSNGLSTSRFSGAAVVAVPVIAVIDGPAPLARKL
ncbi:ATP-binding protein [Ancylobacter defluvii]|uniref:Murein endopeptidase K n=1 Tax=Ancylobacter defluvii TaxID=1282440 RepID=A0A9W6N964_9HYPH|nr:ATP-binding protein [Ancylobacter defluvii]